jgi:MbtH protein
MSLQHHFQRERGEAMSDDEDSALYRVVVNDEEQYSIYLADRELPPGWHDGGMSGSKQDCLAHIGKVWTDMRPLSLRRTMAEAERRSD